MRELYFYFRKRVKRKEFYHTKSKKRQRGKNRERDRAKRRTRGEIELWRGDHRGCLLLLESQGNEGE